MDLLDDVVFGDGVGTSIIQGNTASDNSTQFNVGGDMRLDLRVSKLQFLKQVAVHRMAASNKFLRLSNFR